MKKLNNNENLVRPLTVDNISKKIYNNISKIEV